MREFFSNDGSGFKIIFVFTGGQTRNAYAVKISSKKLRKMVARVFIVRVVRNEAGRCVRGIILPDGVLAGVTRLELATSCVTGKRSNQLSYTPNSDLQK